MNWPLYLWGLCVLICTSSTIATTPPVSEEIAGYLSYTQAIDTLYRHPEWSLSEMEMQIPIPSSPFLAQKLALQMVLLSIQHHRPNEAKQKLTHLLSTAKSSLIRTQAFKLAIACALQKRDFEEAKTAYRDLLCSGTFADPEGRILKTINKDLGTNLHPLDVFDSEKDMLNYLKVLLVEENYPRLVDSSIYFLSHFQKSRLLAEVYFLQGLGYFKQHQFFAASQAMDMALTLSESPKLSNASRYYASDAFFKIKNMFRACRLIVDGLKVPGNPYQALSYYLLCRYAQSYNMYREYDIYKSRFKEFHSDSLIFKQFKWENDWELLKQKPSDSIPNTLKKVGILADIKKFYSSTFGEPINWSQSIQKAPVSYALFSNIRGLHQSDFPQFIQKYDQLYKMGFKELAIEALRYEREISIAPNSSSYSNALYTQAVLSAKQTPAQELIQSLSITLGVNTSSFLQIPRAFMTFLYPRPHWDIILRYSKKYRIDPYLVLAIMREESHFNTRSLSPRDARGLLQLQPDTAREVAFRAGIYLKDTDHLYDPSINIHLGTYYIAYLKRLFPQNIHYVLCAYNAGPDTTARWIKEFGTIDFEKFLKKVPYTETQFYTKNVLNSYILYKILYL